MSTTTNLSTLKINYLTQAQYDAALANSEINENEIYLTPDSGSGGITAETDPVFTASPAYGITANDISGWNGKSDFSGDYDDLTNKPTIPTKTSDLTNDSNFEENTIEKIFVGGAFVTPDADKSVSLPTIPPILQGTTGVSGVIAQTDPSAVYDAVASGDVVVISHHDTYYGYLNFSGFTLSQSMHLVVSTVLLEYNNVLYEYSLIGDTSTETWTTSMIALAKTTDVPTVPTNVSAFTNDAGYITGYTETDPTVPAWAKESTKPSYTASEVGALATSGGQLTGDLTLYVPSGNSPAIIFQRGTLTDNFNDWKIYDKSGFLYFAQRGSGSSAFGDMGYIDTTGVLRGFTIPWGSVSGKPTFATVATSGSYNDLSDKPTIPDGLPSVTTADNGKVLRVVNGAWSAVALPSASGVSF